MSLHALVRGAFRRIPPSMRAVVTLRDKAGNRTTGTAVGVPASGDRLAAGTTVGQATESFALLPEGLAFAPTAGMTLERGSETWRILDVPTLRPNGATPALYRLTVTR